MITTTQRGPLVGSSQQVSQGKNYTTDNTSSQFLSTTPLLQHNQTDRMASKLLSKMVSSKIDGIFKGDSDDEKTPPTDKELKVNLYSAVMSWNYN